jgi:hypothetical protein
MGYWSKRRLAKEIEKWENKDVVHAPSMREIERADVNIKAGGIKTSGPGWPTRLGTKPRFEIDDEYEPAFQKARKKRCHAKVEGVDKIMGAVKRAKKMGGGDRF